MTTLSGPTLPEPAGHPDPAAAWRTLRPLQDAASQALPSELESAAVAVQLSQDGQPHDCTLLEVMMAVSEVTDDDAEVLATVSHMLKSGRVRLTQGVEYEQADPAA